MRTDVPFTISVCSMACFSVPIWLILGLFSSILGVVLAAELGANSKSDAAMNEGQDAITNSYAQHQQDVIVMQQIFPGKRDGVFVEIGAHDGLEISNTLLMEEMGWTGMLIEANEKVYQKLLVNRPNAINIFGAAYDRDGTVEFRQLDGYTEMLSGIVETVDPRHVERMKYEMSILGGNEKIVTVPCFEITSLLLRHNLANIDYMSIDVEGAEIKILRSLDFSRLRVTLIQIENNYLDKSVYDDILIPHGYTWVGNIVTDLFYTTMR